jgi:hypothetical protein
MYFIQKEEGDWGESFIVFRELPRKKTEISTKQVVPTAVHHIQISFLLIVTEGIQYRTALYWMIMYVSSLHSSMA